jgi:hypothetical protein
VVALDAAVAEAGVGIDGTLADGVVVVAVVGAAGAACFCIQEKEEQKKVNECSHKNKNVA